MSDELVVAAIKPELVPMIWPILEPMLARAIEHSNGELDSDEVFGRAVRGDMVLITISKKGKIIASLALEQRDFDTGKVVLNITLAGGEDASDWIEKMDEVVQNLARDYKCDEIYIIGRKGWVRKLRGLGYNEIHTVVSKKVEVA